MNKNLGEIELKVNSKSYTMVYTIGALGEFETAFPDKEIFDLNSKELLQACVFGLKKHHSEVDYDFLADSDLHKEYVQKKLFECILMAQFGVEDGEKRFQNFMKAIKGVQDAMEDQAEEEPKKK